MSENPCEIYGDREARSRFGEKLLAFRTGPWFGLREGESSAEPKAGPVGKL